MLWTSGFIFLGIGHLFWLVTKETLQAWGHHEVGLWCLRIGIIGGLLSGIIYGGYYSPRSNSHGIKY